MHPTQYYKSFFPHNILIYQQAKRLIPHLLTKGSGIYDLIVLDILHLLLSLPYTKAYPQMGGYRSILWVSFTTEWNDVFAGPKGRSLPHSK